MKKTAMLIGSDRMTSEQVPGADADIRTILNHLLSPVGGAWSRDEIVILPHPSKEELQYIADNIEADFSFVYFAGHGGYDPEIDSNVLYLNNNEQILYENLSYMALKSLLVIDACRVLIEEEEEGGRGFGMLKEGRDASTYAILCRALYERYLERCEYGMTTLVSCSIGQEAFAGRRGGVFTQALIDNINAWQSQVRESKQVLTVRNVYRMITNDFTATRRIRVQKPELFEGRRLNSFPLAVCP